MKSNNGNKVGYLILLGVFLILVLLVVCLVKVDKMECIEREKYDDPHQNFDPECNKEFSNKPKKREECNTCSYNGAATMGGGDFPVSPDPVITSICIACAEKDNCKK